MAKQGDAVKGRNTKRPFHPYFWGISKNMGPPPRFAWEYGGTSWR